MIEHGTVDAYNHHGCRCDPCRAAKSEYARKYNQKHKQRYKEKKRWYKEREAPLPPLSQILIQ
jgi:hypothetical protein